ncbi:DUF397 domain-containing protein [Streptomyces megasporus]|uniref:DUF397 domain-containing protein n=1 Tax=Streptomyces megasporus TaxID=44060 RepID=UPI0009973335|nr:DUF397 domain-containing protein [Streptomyces megasporus]
MTSTPSTEAVSTLEWIKSSHSTPDGPDCVEVATAPDTVRVRDSKHIHGPRLVFTPGAWSDFLTRTAGRGES